MPQPQPAQLSRAVSSVDLNAALTATQNKQRVLKYERAELLDIKPKFDLEKHVEHIEVKDIGSDEDPAPPSHATPKPPPPTPEVYEGSPVTVLSPRADDQTEKEELDLQVGAEPKVKKKKKSKSKKKTAAATGFEEFYADPPVTPAEHVEESALYNSSLPLYERIEACLQRYRARRNLDSERSNILTKYFMLGGIEAGPKPFTGGLDKDTIEASTADEIREIQATDFIRVGNKKYYDPSDSDNWVVDFEGVAAGFFAYRVPQQLPIDKLADVKLYTSVIRNFLNYILAHDVCPEHVLDVMAARRICDKADQELWVLKELRRALPGDFNIAASTRYGGSYQGTHLSTQGWASEDPASEAYIDLYSGQSLAQAERIFKTAIAFKGSDNLFQRALQDGIHIVKTETKCYELVKIERADQQILRDVSTVKDHNDKVGLIKALGVMHVKYWEGPGFDEEDVTDDESTDQETIKPTDDKIETFWIEDEILKLMFVGLKMELVVQELSIGIKFFDSVIGLYNSFHTVLPNEKMVGWKEPVPNTRPPPTEDDPDSEERALNAIMDTEA